MDTTASVSGSMILKGLLLILFGAAAVFWPGETLVTLAYLFSALVLVNGIFDIVFGIGRMVGGAEFIFNRALLLLFGIFQVGVGIYLLRHPSVNFRTFILLIGFTLLIRGLFEIVDGLFEDSTYMYRAVMVIGGVLAALAGILVFFQPVAAGIAFVWILGVYALIVGPLLIALALDVARMNRLGVRSRARAEAR